MTIPNSGGSNGAELAASVEGRLLEVLKRTWGFDAFRPLQLEAMRCVAEHRDSLVVLPTGGGKSLCFQAPALLGDDLGIVVSPLISLMKDQVDGLAANGVAAATLHSAQSEAEREATRAALAAGSLRLLYLAPERLVGPSGDRLREELSSVRVGFVAIDEAHCISQWGHDFRPEYRQLGELREAAFPEASFHAFTATATPRVRSDIVDRLALRHAEVLVGEFDRPNLTYRARHRADLGSELRSALERHRGEAGIVYCLARKDVDRWAERLRGWGHDAVPYHAGLADEERHANQEAFLTERADVVVATVAFGMGIDRPDVRFVIHAASPRSLEHYQQESGRAGRDGQPAECLLLYSAGDFATWRRLLASDERLDDASRRLLNDMWSYAAATRCRHRALVEYFGQTYPEADCGACDWCLGELEPVDDPTTLARKILSGVARLDQRWGMAHLIDTLRGRATDKVGANGHDRLSTFGLLADTSAVELRGYVEQLLDLHHLEQVGDPYPTLRLSASGIQALKGDTEVALYRQHRPRKAVRKAKPAFEGDSWEGVDGDLFAALRDLRREIAAEGGVPPYVVFHDAALRDMARRKPSTELELLAVYGVGEVKAKKFGPRFLAAIAAHLGHDDS